MTRVTVRSVKVPRCCCVTNASTREEASREEANEEDADGMVEVDVVVERAMPVPVDELASLGLVSEEDADAHVDGVCLLYTSPSPRDA